MHIYGQFVPGAFQSWSGDWSAVALAAYPTTPPGFWFTALVLGVIPVFILSLLLVASSLSQQRVSRAAISLSETMKSLQQSGQIAFRITIRNEKLSALRKLLSNKPRRLE